MGGSNANYCHLTCYLMQGIADNEGTDIWAPYVLCFAAPCGDNDREENQMKTVRIRQKIKAFLSDKPRNTAEILEHINSTMRHGTTSQQLGNVLSKDKDILKVGYIKRSGLLSGGYEICEWATRTWVSENVPEWRDGDPILLN